LRTRQIRHHIRANFPREYLLFVKLRGRDEPILAARVHTVAELLRALSDWEGRGDFVEAWLEIQDNPFDPGEPVLYFSHYKGAK
jgi:hypothetical protein